MSSEMPDWEFQCCLEQHATLVLQPRRELVKIIDGVQHVKRVLSWMKQH